MTLNSYMIKVRKFLICVCVHLYNIHRVTLDLDKIPTLAQSLLLCKSSMLTIPSLNVDEQVEECASNSHPIR